MQYIVRLSFVLVVALAAARLAAEAPVPDGQGGLLREGKPYRGIGMNSFDLFLRRIQNPDNTSYREDLKTLAEYGIPFVRFNCGGFWPVEWKTYQEDPDAYFAMLDDVVHAAEEHGVGLVPSLFWLTSTVPDLVGEPRNQWGNPESKTIAFMRTYVADVVGRYKDSPAIWAWELGNEYNLAMDLPNPEKSRPWIHPKLGTPESRSEADDVTHAMFYSAFAEFAKAVREHDTQHMVTSGDSLPRAAAWHLATEGSWTKDTPEQFQQMLLDASPDPINLISVHVYPFDSTTRFEGSHAPYERTLTLAMDAARSAVKVLFVGEFGASHKAEDGGPDVARREVGQMIAAIERSGVPLAAYWVYNFPPQAGDYSVTLDNDRAYVMKALQQANQRLAMTAEGGHKADVSGATWAGTVWDNAANGPRSGSGFNPLYHAAYPGRNLFRDDGVGLNFEHIFNGAAADKDISMFTPRKDACEITVHAPDDVTITWKAEDSAWAMDCAMRYTLIEDGVDMAFTCTPREARYPLGYAALMWASYMNHTRGRGIHFKGPEGWVAFGEADGSEAGFETGTVAYAGVAPLPYEEGAQTLNIVEHPEKAFVKPFYYGVVDGDGKLDTEEDAMAYIMMFDQTDPIRFAMWNFIKNAAGEADPHSPAWDWQYVIRDPEVGKTYGYKARMMYVPFTSAADVETVYEGWGK